MKNLVIVFIAILFAFTGCKKEKQFQELKSALDKMSYAEYKYFSKSDYRMLLQEIRDNTMQNIEDKEEILIGDEYFEAYLYSSDTIANYAYRLESEEYDLYIALHEDFTGQFTIMKKWDIPTQDKYHKKMPYWIYDGIEFFQSHPGIFISLFGIACICIGYWLRGYVKK